MWAKTTDTIILYLPNQAANWALQSRPFELSLSEACIRLKDGSKLCSGFVFVLSVDGLMWGICCVPVECRISW